MKKPTELTIHPITIDFEHAKATLHFLYQLVERLETDYYLALRNHQQQSLPGLPEPLPNDPPFNDPLPF
ncbi:MAG: hypothetical protein RQ729_00715 [Wenzhouxiangellaceae bacterium]|nr:hypothetical protein [Wenzhouxiangellaceae bacterium]